MSWHNIENPLQPWVASINRILSSITFEPITGKTLVIASDFGGNDKRHTYRTYVYLCFDADASREWEDHRRHLRTHLLPNARRMSYKSLNDGHRRRALRPFLSNADRLRGICVAVIIDKRIRRIAVENVSDYRRFREKAHCEAPWKDRELEEALRVTHMIGILVGGLSHPDQSVFCFVDQDNMFGNPRQSKDVANLLSLYSSRYVPFRLGELSIGTTAIDEDRFEEDIAAIPDLVAGALAASTTHISLHCGGYIPSGVVVDCRLPRGKANPVLRWFCSRNSSLRRVAVLFAKQPKGGYSVSRHNLAIG